MDYVGEVTKAFGSRLGPAAIIDTDDYAQIAEWEKQEIPVFIVVLAITEAFDEPDGAAKEIGCITDLRDEVKRRFGAWLRETAAKGG